MLTLRHRANNVCNSKLKKNQTVICCYILKWKGTFPNISGSSIMLSEDFVQSHTEIKAPPADPSNHHLFWQLLSDQSLKDRCLRRSDSPLCITAVSLDWCVYIMSSIDMVISERHTKQGSEEIGRMKSPSFLTTPPTSTIFLSLPSLCNKLIKLPGALRKPRSDLSARGEHRQFWSFTLSHMFLQNTVHPGDMLDQPYLLNS